MAKSTKRKKRTNKQWKTQMKFELCGLLLLTFGLLALFHFGAAGNIFVQFFRFFVGDWHPLLNIFVMGSALYMIAKRKLPVFKGKRWGGLFLTVITILLLSHLELIEGMGRAGAFQESSAIITTWELFWIDAVGLSTAGELGGGMAGAVLFVTTHFLFGSGGTRIIAMLFFILSFLLITGLSIKDVSDYLMKKIGPGLKKSFAAGRQKWSDAAAKTVRKKTDPKEKNTRTKEQSQTAAHEQEIDEQEPVIYNFAEHAYPVDTPGADNSNKSPDIVPTKAEPRRKESPNNEPKLEAEPLITGETENKDYVLPSPDLLGSPKHNSQKHERGLISSNARKLEKTLESFGVKARVNEVHLGPAVTKYEVQPDTGVKVSKIVNLADDLALALAAKDIRMEAPIPGKSAIGIEVPNQEVAMVTLREVLEAGFKKKDHVLSVGLGRDISGEPVLASLDKMPHLLVAGATGSGKSVCINGIISSILMKARPHEVKLMMIDPKMVELNVYNGVPHLLAPVVTEPKKAAQALKKVVAEMERRYDLFSHSGTRNIGGYNDFIKRQNNEKGEKQPELPYIVVIVDELADLMMVASSDVEDAITRLAQMARAAGIHMIIATQRPSVDVITGVIKANIPSRIAFGVSSQIDSRTILDSSGAEKLLGKGDMLFQPVGANKATRVQGAFVSDHEVEAIVDAVISQQKASYQEEMIPDDKPEVKAEVSDELYDEAVALILQMQSASVSMLQRRFRIGYTRAARLIDEMEMRGIVGPYEGSKPREVLVSRTEEEIQSR
ncbi:DNA translocase FtsK [Alteribacillus sp. HJP-4]|uniref:FtsK/SpoIIIE family DNA translocase n=1 Tax=Alteribacillus sp. HJP-4 TaxID=2775394 RepID=UPI0035CCEE0B